jgi:Glycosyltransferase
MEKKFDYCQQAKARGFVHVLATDVFVWHYSGASFGNEKWRRILASTQLINQLHPDYSKDVGRFCQHDPLAHHRLVITLWVLSQQDFQGILVITHALGGGIDRYLDDRAKALSNGEFLLLLQPTRVAHFCDVIFMHRGIRIAIALEVEGPHAIADAIRDLFPIHAVEIHSTVGYDMQLLFAILRSLQLSFKFFVHDFASICPRIQPRDEQNVFCGLPDTSSCNQCLQSAGETTDITSWRHQHQWLLYGAQQLIAPSRNTADLLRLVHAGLDPLVVPHEDQERILRERIRNQIKRLDKSAKDTVSRTVVIGRLTPHKGLHLVESISKLLALHGAEIVIIGTVEGASFLAMQKHVSIVGAYKDNDLLALIEQINPDVIFFPARWPETYSYTLSTALQSGYPLLAANVGAFSERMRDISECTLYRLSDSVEHIASLLMDLMSRNFDASSTPHRSMGGTTSDPLLVRFRS